MTAKEKLLREVLDLDEAKAARARIEIVEAETDAVRSLLDEAPFEDEEISAEEEAAVQEAREEVAGGVALISHEEIKRKHRLQ